MESTANIESLKEALSGLSSDIRAEVLVQQAIQAGITHDMFAVKNSLFFENGYAKDIAALDVVEDQWLRRFLEIRLSRPGLYDMLPESLFFQPDSSDLQRRNGIAEMAALYKQNKAKEKELRSFFQPFENEFFHQELQLEREELALLDVLNHAAVNRFLLQFWELPAKLPAQTAASLMLLIPYAHLICGNVSLMQQSLCWLLQEQVTVSLKEPEPVKAGDDLQPGMGMLKLGEDMICGSSFQEDYPVLVYHIGPLKNSGIEDYLERGSCELLLDTFSRFFVPAEADVVIEIAIDRKSGSMSFNAEEAPVLGFSSVL